MANEIADIEERNSRIGLELVKNDNAIRDRIQKTQISDVITQLSDSSSDNKRAALHALERNEPETALEYLDREYQSLDTQFQNLSKTEQLEHPSDILKKYKNDRVETLNQIGVLSFYSDTQMALSAYQALLKLLEEEFETQPVSVLLRLGLLYNRQGRTAGDALSNCERAYDLTHDNDIINIRAEICALLARSKLIEISDNGSVDSDAKNELLALEESVVAARRRARDIAGKAEEADSFYVRARINWLLSYAYPKDIDPTIFPAPVAHTPNPDEHCPKPTNVDEYEQLDFVRARAKDAVRFQLRAVELEEAIGETPKLLDAKAGIATYKMRVACLSNNSERILWRSIKITKPLFRSVKRSEKSMRAPSLNIIRLT